MSTQKKQSFDRVINIKGLSWMLRSCGGTSSACSTNSSHINQQFKIFKLKDQKKKWKKKINKKFQTVADNIQHIIQSKYSIKEPFDINYKKQPNLKHIPHLRQIKSVYLGKSSLLQLNSKEVRKQKQNLTLIQSTVKPHTQQAVTKRPFTQQDQNANQSKNIRYSYRQSSTKPQTFHSTSSCIKRQKQTFDLKKSLNLIKIQNNKVIKARNLLKIHQKQKTFMKKQNQQFFRIQTDLINKKTQFYKDFDIRDYQKKLIQKKCKQL